jgi:hypothetical protein
MGSVCCRRGVGSEVRLSRLICSGIANRSGWAVAFRSLVLQSPSKELLEWVDWRWAGLFLRSAFFVCSPALCDLLRMQATLYRGCDG